MFNEMILALIQKLKNEGGTPTVIKCHPSDYERFPNGKWAGYLPVQKVADCPPGRVYIF